MKKIMFNDKCGLTDAVLDGSKTMTRRPVGNRMTEDDIKAYLKGYTELANKAARYKIDEVVAVAQSYKDVYNTNEEWLISQCAANEQPVEYRFDEAGWDNKIFAKAYYMPHQIRITDIKVERLQDISSEDCMKEGIWWEYVDFPLNMGKVYCYDGLEKYRGFHTPRTAFAALIDKVSGKGTWERNPWVFAYSFELVK